MTTPPARVAARGNCAPAGWGGAATARQTPTREFAGTANNSPCCETDVGRSRRRGAAVVSPSPEKEGACYHVFFRLCFRDRIMEDALHRSVHLFTGWAGEASLSRGSCHVAAGYARAAVRASTPAGARKPVPGDFQTAGEETAQKEGGSAPFLSQLMLVIAARH